MPRITIAVLVLSVALAGCKAKEMIDKADISKDLEKRGTTELMKQVADDTYEAPEDGKLTEAQVQMYLKVREHEKKIAQVAKAELEKHAAAAKQKEKSLAGMMEGFKALGSVADFATADIRAAKDLGFNTQEYLWVKGQILAVSTSVIAEKSAQAIQASTDAAYNEMKKSYDAATDEQTKKMYEEMLASYDKSRQETAAAMQQDADPAVEHNKQLLSKYENALNAWANEAAKWESKEGEAQKSVDDWQKQIDEQIRSAKQ